jgi:hypothetical protein
MAIDRNARARLFQRIQADRSLTLGARAIARAIVQLSDGMGRCRRTYDAVASTAGVDRRTVSRALRYLGRYLDIHRSRQVRPGRNGGRLVMARGVNLYMVRLPADFAASHKGQNATESTNQPNKPISLPSIDNGLASALARLGHAIADRRNNPLPLKQ